MDSSYAKKKIVGFFQMFDVAISGLTPKSAAGGL